MKDTMSPARLACKSGFVATICAFSFATHAEGAPLQSVDLPLPEHAKPALAVSNLRPIRSMATPVPLVKTSDLPAHPVRRVTSSSRMTKASSTGGTAAARAADFESRGNFAMQAGQSAEAIAAFQHVLKLAPKSPTAWGKLAFLYLKEGDSTKAIEAFKKAKEVGDPNGGMVTRDASGGLLFP
jgi:hypothetical protein